MAEQLDWQMDQYAKTLDALMYETNSRKRFNGFIKLIKDVEAMFGNSWVTSPLASVLESYHELISRRQRQ